MPASGRKGKTRARRAPAAEAHEPSDAETPEAIATPSRSSRKRARGGEAAPSATRNTRRKVKDTPAVEREDTEGTEAQEPSDAETEPTTPTEAEIIQHLRVADRQVNATEDYANDLLEGQENVPGYGKIAGRDWAFIIRKVEVNIGRPEAQEKMVVDETGREVGPSAKTVVDIDLGPDRQVSRSHAIISYDPDNMQWFIVVNGRNGLRVDNNLMKRGTKMYLRNGSVIEVANTQMAFITTATDDGDGPVWDDSIIKQAQKSSGDDDEGEDDTRASNNRQHAHPAVRNQMPQPTTYSGDYGGQQHRTHPHSQRAMQIEPGTPLRPQQSFMKSSPAANYARGVMMESTESIDYSAENAKDLKPPHSYAQLIGMAILSTPEQQMTLNNIYKWIMANYAFYRFNTGGWQNSIRHNLSLNKAFTKIARRTDEPGKGMKWMIEPTEFDTFVQQGMKGCRRPQPLPATQSTLDSPTSPLHAMRPGANGSRADEDITPPMQAYQPLYRTATEAYTPERGPRRQVEGHVGLGINGDGTDYDFLTRSTPRNGLTAAANAINSPPTLYINDEGRVGPLDTPFPLRPSQRLAPPSTLKRPSDFIQFSSPAPFWKMDGLVGSTPFKPYDLSPLKTPFSTFKRSEIQIAKHEEFDDDEEEEDEEEDEKEMIGEPSSEAVNGATKGSPIIHSSSPPRAHSSGTHDRDASPTLSRPATAVAKTLTQLASANMQMVANQLVSEIPESHVNSGMTASREETQTPPTASTATMPALPIQSHGPVAVPSGQAQGLPPMQNHMNSHSTQPSMNGYHPSNGQHLVQNGSYGPLVAAAPTNGTYGTVPAGPSTNGTYGAAAVAAPTNGYHVDDAEDEGIDLAKGFQPIGVFHQHNHNMAVGMGIAGAPAAFRR
ncbi:hypothetical protein LTR36_009500 [Oleoguttula mirabilis]|uniref:Uncharacterized protein n=1 Tax=Oleoguttula mirabilis TaxID=1507867 RepID=A0AAV9JSF4_9PEZI|nr:hypothetical protein LTR36_009500 [Oleoguttula mirabilis]